MQLLCEFTIWGEPLPKERPRFGRGKIFTPSKTASAEQEIRDTFYKHYPLWEPTNADLHLELGFFRRTRRPVDVDNLIKLVQDALNQHLYSDDKQISELQAGRYYRAGDKARTEVRVYSMPAVTP